MNNLSLPLGGGGAIVALMPPFRRTKKQPTPPAEHAVVTHLPLSDDQFGTEQERDAVHDLERRIETAMAAVGGDHDGDEFGGGEAVLYTYGPDADQVFAAVRDCMKDFPLRPGAYAIKRYGRAGDPNIREERVSLS